MLKKKLGKLYKIDETIGKSLLTIDDDDDEYEDPKDRKAMIISDDDENSHLSSNENQNTETTKPAVLSPSLTTNNRLSPSPSKDDPSPGEIRKPMSPSSLSEGSPILD